MTTITLNLDPDVMRVIETLAHGDPEKMERVINAMMRQIIAPKTMFQIMEQIGAQAAANGMTPEILQEILNDDSDDE